MKIIVTYDRKVNNKNKDRSYDYTEKRRAPSCLIIGSFRKHYALILEIIQMFNQYNISVLSPLESNIINPQDDFVLFTYNLGKQSMKEIQSEVFKKMHQVDIVYLVNPKGYIGVSAAFELGYCIAHSIPIYLMEKSNEVAAQFANGVMTPKEIINILMKEYQL